jgi:arsenite methyltransferase
MMTNVEPAETAAVKACCANIYQSDLARWLLGDTFHPGGLALTERLGVLLQLGPGQRVLDVAAGQGSSAIFLAERFGCQIVGVDYGPGSVAAATGRAEQAGLSQLVHFGPGDAEQLQFADHSFDAVICECAFCTFPNKTAAAGEFARVLRPGGRLGLSDLIRSGALPQVLDSLLAWIACIADARSVGEYAVCLEVAQIESHDIALLDMVKAVQAKLLGAELLVKLKKIEVAGADFEQARRMARAATEAINQGQLGYGVLVGVKPPN